MPRTTPIVFISYSHDSAEHNERVLRFANALRSHGIDAELDRYETRPPKGWANWCEEQLRPEKSDFVLMVCTKTYSQRIQDKVPADEGRGVFWEGAIIYDYIYDRKGNTRFIPIFFDSDESQSVPPPLLNHTRYCIHTFSLREDPGYVKLYRELTKQPDVTKPPLGHLVSLGDSIAPASTLLEALEVRPVKWTIPSSDLGEGTTDLCETERGHENPRPQQPNLAARPKRPDAFPQEVAQNERTLLGDPSSRTDEKSDDPPITNPRVFVAPATPQSAKEATRAETPVEPKPAHWILIQMIVFGLGLLGVLIVYFLWRFFGPSN